jgi:hypothetical protein
MATHHPSAPKIVAAHILLPALLAGGAAALGAVGVSTGIVLVAGVWLIVRGALTQPPPLLQRLPIWRLLRHVEPTVAQDLGASLARIDARLAQVREAIARDHQLVGAPTPAALAIALERLVTERAVVVDNIRRAHALAIGCEALEDLPPGSGGAQWLAREEARFEVNQLAHRPGEPPRAERTL